ncbi:hypothetical protein Y032_0008g274 [Ancylostoma ceylanicum]|uniref:Uncharacterized protein n=1 Tax=Ancylostoma ceylanicum TaxID=53326 RepID=A0A016VL21_9BILA|nr:hypothetical protein Y032_0008g274 [Ancylostoma ceylanicum]
MEVNEWFRRAGKAEHGKVRSRAQERSRQFRTNHVARPKWTSFLDNNRRALPKPFAQVIMTSWIKTPLLPPILPYIPSPGQRHTRNFKRAAGCGPVPRCASVGQRVSESMIGRRVQQTTRVPSRAAHLSNKPFGVPCTMFKT